MPGLLLATAIYASTMKVVELNYDTDIVTLETASGYLYEANGTEDYLIGDYVSLIMNDNGTPEITDDTIISARYSGFTDSFEIN